MEVIRFVLDGKPYKTAPEGRVYGCDGCVARNKGHEECERLNNALKASGHGDSCVTPGHVYHSDPEALVEKDPGGWIIDNPVRIEPSPFKDPPMRSGMAPVAAYARLTDPPTSKDAAKKAGGGKLVDLILNVMNGGHYEPRDEGWTGKELTELLARPLNSITPRFAQLRRAGLIHAAGKRDRQIVWKIGNGVAA